MFLGGIVRRIERQVKADKGTTCRWGAKLEMFRAPRPRRVLVLAPHPDDEVVGCGGYLAVQAADGAEITVVFVTDGGRGPDGKRDGRLAKRRRLESRKAAEVIGIRRTVHWGLADGELESRSLPEKQFSELVEELNTELILVPDPREAHPDHAAVARLPARLAPVLADSLTIMTYEVWTPLAPACVVNVTSTMDAKLQSIRAYESQCQMYNLELLATGLAQYRAAWSRMRAWRFAEGFGRFRLKQYREYCHED